MSQVTKLEKRCYGCKLMLPADSFHKDASHPSGLAGYCIPCDRQKQKDRLAARSPEYRKARSKKCTAYNDLHKDELKGYFANYQKENRERVNGHAANRRARLANAYVESIDYAIVYNRDEGTCGICGKFVELEDFSLDHIIAIANGGLHCYENVQTSHLICNIKKGVS